MVDKKAHLGIDWGTHSAKWAGQIEGDVGFFPTMPLYSSDLEQTGDSLTFSPDPATPDEESLIKSIKQRLIQDPLGQDFWGANRQDTGTSLGEAVAFSLCCLLRDAVSHIERNVGTCPIDIGFSFPNWLVAGTKEAKAAVKHFRQAAEVAVSLLVHVPSNELPLPQKGFPIIRWKDLVSQFVTRAREGDSGDETLSVDNMTQRVFRSPKSEVTWSFLVESGAAGLPYLRARKSTTKRYLAHPDWQNYSWLMWVQVQPTWDICYESRIEKQAGKTSTTLDLHRVFRKLGTCLHRNLRIITTPGMIR